MYLNYHILIYKVFKKKKKKKKKKNIYFIF